MCLLSKASPDVVSAQQRRDAEQVFVTFQHSQASFDVCKYLLGQCDLFVILALFTCIHLTYVLFNRNRFVMVYKMAVATIGWKKLTVLIKRSCCSIDSERPHCFCYLADNFGSYLSIPYTSQWTGKCPQMPLSLGGSGPPPSTWFLGPTWIPGTHSK